jgi:AraC family transcriptional regulator of adaptative response/methylated-DNA-[protein]-cysteine methyltransferase
MRSKGGMSEHLPPPIAARAFSATSAPSSIVARSDTPAARPPDAETCWRGLLTRDRAFNGRFFFSVKTTGVYCLPSCSARTPRRENVAFHATCDDAETAGFRACKRCRPRDWRPDIGLSKQVARACRLLDANDGEDAPSLATIARAVGLSPSALTRRFQGELGVAPRDWRSARKLDRFRAALRDGESVSGALYGAGFGSTSRVYESADRTLGMTPATYRRGGLGARIAYTTAACSVGRVLVAATEQGVAAVLLGESDAALETELRRDFPAADLSRDDGALKTRAAAVLARLDGRKPSALDAADAPLDIVGTAFQWRVWKALTEIPAGETRTYGDIARRIGKPSASRAVGRACATNPVALLVPCHRAVGASGALTGYRWGVGRKKKLLAAEAARAAR